jgi:hypothetical protein
MEKLNKYVVPVQTALDHSDLLDQDGIVGVNPDIEIDDIEFYEEE